MLELTHFPEELLDVSDFKEPAAKPIGKPELSMAMKLVESMSEKWHPEMFKDDYHERIEKVVKQKIRSGGKSSAPTKKRGASSKVIDLVSVVQQSIKDAKGRSRPGSKPAKEAA